MKNKMISNSEPLKRFSSYDLTDLQTKQLEINRLRLKIERNKKYQLCREMAYMVDKYGDDVFEWIKGNETKFIKSQKFLKKHFLRKETRAILSLIYRSYLCSPNQSKKYKIDDIIALKEQQLKLKATYNYDNIFKKDKKND